MKTKNYLLSTGLAILFLVTVSKAQNSAIGIQFSNLTWEQAQAKALDENRYIFVDFYATWCGPCKYLEKEVFTNTDVGEYFNANFVNIRIDAENEELALVESILLEAYPTLIVFDKQGNLVVSSVGAVEAPELIAFGEKAVNFESVFLAYKNSPNDYLKLGRYLSYIHDSEPDKANDLALIYLNKLDEDILITEEAWSILKYVNDYNSEVIIYVYDNLSDSPSWLDPLFDNLTYTLVNKALKDAVENLDLNALARCKKIETDYRKASGTMDEPEAYYHLETDIIYAKYTKDYVAYTKLLEKQSRTYYWDKPRSLEENSVALVETFYQTSTEQPIKEVALSWVTQSKMLEPDTWHAFYTEAVVYYYYDEYKKAGAALGTALELIGDSDLESHTMLLDFNDELVALIEDQ